MTLNWTIFSTFAVGFSFLLLLIKSPIKYHTTCKNIFIWIVGIILVISIILLPMTIDTVSSLINNINIEQLYEIFKSFIQIFINIYVYIKNFINNLLVYKDFIKILNKDFINNLHVDNIKNYINNLSVDNIKDFIHKIDKYFTYETFKNFIIYLKEDFLPMLQGIVIVINEVSISDPINVNTMFMQNSDTESVGAISDTNSINQGSGNSNNPNSENLNQPGNSNNPNTENLNQPNNSMPINQKTEDLPDWAIPKTRPCPCPSDSSAPSADPYYNEPWAMSRWWIEELRESERIMKEAMDRKEIAEYYNPDDEKNIPLYDKQYHLHKTNWELLYKELHENKEKIIKRDSEIQNLIAKAKEINRPDPYDVTPPNDPNYNGGFDKAKWTEEQTAIFERKLREAKEAGNLHRCIEYQAKLSELKNDKKYFWKLGLEIERRRGSN